MILFAPLLALLGNKMQPERELAPEPHRRRDFCSRLDRVCYHEQPTSTNHHSTTTVNHHGTSKLSQWHDSLHNRVRRS